ncbi:efflux RND transporter periplasmic adaptor subunit [Pseudomonas cannabina]|uniref:Efflux RND transporter periplasmic adaptor subunit n=1 Tax=Pseudomonas syringae pv. maculicola str. ES4326 TaxID=629265 RepID=A0A8T8BY58_PSEYM|nr:MULTISPECIES: efflux RND transporter periplasmic adaptor subunit [Pseudomonas syringae group]KPB76926.1 HlyD family secretion protein [Pseudomonas syringae pv. maculicola]QHE96221.1 efflux RND transporter periplasmic adaptor subunit [Pseudomonas syringae pv. maculicola str. ES4326]QQN20719.1 efflux RND transporter periplasmic adaptor subunit [Pseudomonas cannabina pv. alisalensis]UBY96875.1 efflux RND transporter periplasmic adaptor subunit [Pseudomonas cannabina pv. alisalensis]
MRKQTLTITAFVLLAACAAFAVWTLTRPATIPRHTSTAVPVKVITVSVGDVPRFVTGIGSVLSLQSVVIRPQVDGVLTRVLVREGQQVKAGELLATLDDRSIRASLEQAKAQLAQSKAQLDVAQLDLKRYRQLTEDNGISRQTFDQQQALVKQLGATAQGNEASINSAQVQLSYTQIRSPVTGRVGIRNVDEGNFLRVSDAQGLFSVTQIDPIAVEFSLPQQMLPTLQGLVAEHTAAAVKAYQGDGAANGLLLGEGTLSLIDNQVSATTGTIRAKAHFKNPGEQLWPGQLVTVKIQTGIERNALKVPPQVVQRGVDQHFVYRVLADNKVQVVPVKVLYQDSEQALISGPQAGDVLVSDGQSRLRPGATIEVVSAPTADVAAADAERAQ